MIRRRLIRGMCIAMFALCMVALAASYWRTVNISYAAKPTSPYYVLGIGKGTVYYLQNGSARLRHRAGWYLDITEPFSWSNWGDEFFGSTIPRVSVVRAGDIDAFVPLWLPIAFFAVLVYVIGRKPGCKGAGFPVEVKEKLPR
jgi:hypothetical protein